MHVVLPYYIYTHHLKRVHFLVSSGAYYICSTSSESKSGTHSALLRRQTSHFTQGCASQLISGLQPIYIYIYITTVIGKAPIPLAAPPRRAFSQAPLLKVAMRTFQVEGLDSAQQEGLSGKEGSLAYVSGRPRPSVCPDMAASTVESLPTLTLE